MVLENGILNNSMTYTKCMDSYNINFISIKFMYQYCMDKENAADL